MDTDIQSNGRIWSNTKIKLMKISIEYCMEWNYESRARSLRDDLIKEFIDRFDKFSIEPIQSKGGVFEVMVNDHLQVFSKKQVGRFPKSSYEVIKTINDAIDERRLG